MDGLQIIILNEVRKRHIIWYHIYIWYHIILYYIIWYHIICLFLIYIYIRLYIYIYIYIYIYVESSKNYTNELIDKTETSPQLSKIKLMVKEGKCEGKWLVRRRVNKYILLYIKQIINKELLYSPGKSTQYPVITYMGKECEADWVYAYV